MDAVSPAFTPDRTTPTYYGRPAVKPSLYGFIVALYVYIGGLAAGLQIAVTVAQLLGDPGSNEVALIGRGIALFGAVIGGILLIIDLHTKQRFYNMLRIFRWTSPMSIGTYALMGFGFWSLLAFFGQLAGVRMLGLVCGCLAAATGWWMTTYPAALLSTTATPLWAAMPKLLGVRFAASSLATGAATAVLIALGVVGAGGLTRGFGDLAVLAVGVQLAAEIGSFTELRRMGLVAALVEPPWGQVWFGGVIMAGIVLPVVLYIVANFFAGAGLALAASVFVLVCGLLMRQVIFSAGNASARRPELYFRFASGSGA